MSEHVAFLDGGTTDANGISRAMSAQYVGNGAIAATDLQASQAATPNNTVLIGTGDLILDKKHAWVTASKAVTIAANNSGNPRVDTLVAYIDTTAAGISNNAGALKFADVQGTPAGSPTAPSEATITAAVGGAGVPWWVIADVAVANGFSSITNANITDRRTFVSYASDPIGQVISFAGSSAPFRWLLCDGTAVSRTTYAALFAIIGTSYGAGNGSSTFNLPNLKGRTIVGVDTAQTEFDTLGEVGGAKTVNLQHSHTVNSHTHSISADGSHYHDAAGGGLQGGGNTAFTATSPGHVDTSSSGSHSHSGATGGSAPGTNNALSTTQSVLNPYIALNYIIRAF